MTVLNVRMAARSLRYTLKQTALLGATKSLPVITNEPHVSNGIWVNLKNNLYLFLKIVSLWLTTINFVKDAVIIQYKLRASVTELICIRYDRKGWLESIQFARFLHVVKSPLSTPGFYVPFLKFMYTRNCKEVMTNTKKLSNEPSIAFKFLFRQFLLKRMKDQCTRDFLLASSTHSKKGVSTKFIYSSAYGQDFYNMWWLLKEPFVLEIREALFKLLLSSQSSWAGEQPGCWEEHLLARWWRRRAVCLTLRRCGQQAEGDGEWF